MDDPADSPTDMAVRDHGGVNVLELLVVLQRRPPDVGWLTEPSQDRRHASVKDPSLE